MAGWFASPMPHAYSAIIRPRLMMTPPREKFTWSANCPACAPRRAMCRRGMACRANGNGRRDAPLRFGACKAQTQDRQ
eukprot:scaffold5233_cov127-Isochrysis_galbana.AAC.6